MLGASELWRQHGLAKYLDIWRCIACHWEECFYDLMHVASQWAKCVPNVSFLSSWGVTGLHSLLWSQFSQPVTEPYIHVTLAILFANMCLVIVISANTMRAACSACPNGTIKKGLFDCGKTSNIETDILQWPEVSCGQPHKTCTKLWMSMGENKLQHSSHSQERCWGTKSSHFKWHKKRSGNLYFLVHWSN